MIIDGLMLRSCDFCPDGCCNMDCSYCYGWFDKDAPRTFALNVRDALNAQRAFDAGIVVATKLMGELTNGNWSAMPLWKPGCGRKAP